MFRPGGLIVAIVMVTPVCSVDVRNYVSDEGLDYLRSMCDVDDEHCAGASGDGQNTSSDVSSRKPPAVCRSASVWTAFLVTHRS